MSTFTDGAPPSVTPEPDDRPNTRSAAEGSAATDTGPGWLQDELARRIAARRPGVGGGRHARRDSRDTSAELSDGSGYVPRHSVAPPPAGPPPAAAAPAVPPVRRPTPAWSGPEPRASPAAVGAVAPAGVPDAPPVDPGPGARPAPAEPSADADADAANGTVLGGPSLSRPFPKAFRPGTGGGPREPAVFGGPGFSAPAARTPAARTSAAHPTPAARPAVPAPAPSAEFGGPGFGASIARPDPARPDPARPDPARPDPARPAPERRVDDEPGPPRPQTDSAEVTPPRAPARLLAPPEHVVDAPGRRPEADEWDDDDLPGAIGPVFAAGTPAALRPRDDEESTVLWSADDPPMDIPEQRGRERDPDLDGPDTDTVAVPNRVKVVFAERRNGAPAVRTVVDVQEGGAVGELLRSDLIGSQLAVALRFAIGVALTLGLLPLAFALFPEIGRVEVLGLRLPWLLLGVLVYPFLLGLGWWHTRTAERVEQNFADHVQD